MRFLRLPRNCDTETISDDGGIEEFDEFFVSFATFSVSSAIIAFSSINVAVRFLIFMSLGSSLLRESAGIDLLIDSLLDYFAF